MKPQPCLCEEKKNYQCDCAARAIQVGIFYGVDFMPEIRTGHKGYSKWNKTLLEIRYNRRVHIAIVLCIVLIISILKLII